MLGLEEDPRGLSRRSAYIGLDLLVSTTSLQPDLADGSALRCKNRSGCLAYFEGCIVYRVASSDFYNIVTGMGDTNQMQKLVENIQRHVVDPLEVLGSDANPGKLRSSLPDRTTEGPVRSRVISPLPLIAVPFRL